MFSDNTTNDVIIISTFLILALLEYINPDFFIYLVVGIPILTVLIAIILRKKGNTKKIIVLGALFEILIIAIHYSDIFFDQIYY